MKKSLLVFVGWLAVAPAFGFVPNLTSQQEPRRWKLSPLDLSVSTNNVNRQTRAIRYFLASDGFTAANKTNELNSVRASFDQWQAVSGTLLKFEDAGLTAPGIDVNVDNTNVVFWARNSPFINGGMDNISGVLGVTFTSQFDDNTIAEADLVLNGIEFSWFTDLNNTVSAAYLVEAVTLHEVGHFIGLEHSPVGGATMFTRGSQGIKNTQLGLASDDVAGVRFLYGTAAALRNYATLQGRVTRGGRNVFGAVVSLEDEHGNLHSGTLTDANGNYRLPAVPPGGYQARVTPLDPRPGSPLLSGLDISPSFFDAETDFFATTNPTVTLTAGSAVTRNFAVITGAPLRVDRLRPPTTSSALYSTVNSGFALRPGQPDLIIGIYSDNLPTSNAELLVTGDGLDIGTTFFNSNVFGLNVMSIPISVLSNATPGLRSFIIRSSNETAFVNGFIEISPLVQDYNFDGLNDSFQRRYFPLWTGPSAAPGADPDGDGRNNQRESAQGTDPTVVDAAPALRITSVLLDAAGATLQWISEAGKRYQVFRRDNFENGTWQMVGSPVTAAGTLTTFLDATAREMQFYQVQELP